MFLRVSEYTQGVFRVRERRCKQVKQHGTFLTCTDKRFCIPVCAMPLVPKMLNSVSLRLTKLNSLSPKQHVCLFLRSNLCIQIKSKGPSTNIYVDNFNSIQQQKPYRWINLLMCPSPQNESLINTINYIFANTSSISVIHIKKLHLIIKHTICTGHLRETG